MLVSLKSRVFVFRNTSIRLSPTIPVLVLLLAAFGALGCVPDDDAQADASNQQVDNVERSVLFIAGPPSHSFGQHEHHAGSELLQQTLDDSDVNVHTEISYGWPDDDSAFDDIDAVVIYADGGGGHPVMDHLESFGEVMDRGVGFVAIHYAVEVPADDGGPQFLDWLGGHYETYYSVNPIWTAAYSNFPDHPITRGVEPFQIEDEWYFNIRFQEDDQDRTSILEATPSDETREGPYVHPQGPYDHIVAAQGESATMAWAHERENGGRSFGFTGGHFHWNWGNDNFRRIVANAILWTAHADVPGEGVQTAPISARELAEMIDEPIPEDWDEDAVQAHIDGANSQ